MMCSQFGNYTMGNLNAFSLGADFAVHVMTAVHGDGPRPETEPCPLGGSSCPRGQGRLWVSCGASAVASVHTGVPRREQQRATDYSIFFFSVIYIYFPQK